VKRTLQSLILVIISALLLAPPVEARKISRFTSEVTVPIYGKDTAFARNNAFRTLQKQLLEIAIQDLIGEKQFEKFKEYIFRNSFQKPSNYFISVNIIKERSRSKSFTMKLEGSLQMDAIRTSLKSLNLVFPSDSWHKVDLLVENEIPFDFSTLQARFDLFHLKISSIRYFQNNQFIVARDSSNDTTPLYELVENRLGKANAPIVFIVNFNKESSNELISSIETSIFNRSLRKQVGGLFLNFSLPLTLQSIGNEEQQIYKKYVAHFTHDTLKSDYFETKEQNTITLIVMGLNSPFLKDQFQEELLRPNRKIISYQVVGMTNNEINYQIVAKANRFSTFDILEHKTKGSFDFEVVEEKENQFRVAILSHQKREAKVLSEWIPNNRILDQIRLSQFPQVEEEEVDLDVALDDSLIPTFIEKEPNNHRNNLNLLIPFKGMLGKVSSRGDEDLFQFIGFEPEVVREFPSQASYAL